MQALQYRALERIRTPRPVDRVKTLSGWALGKRILDLGALDETALEQKQGNGRWLHAELCGSAREVLGIDNSEKLPVEGLVTAPNGRIIQFFRTSQGANGTESLWQVDLTGRNLRKLPTPVGASDPAWGPVLP